MIDDFWFLIISVISSRTRRLRSSQRSAMSSSPNWEQIEAGFHKTAYPAHDCIHIINHTWTVLISVHIMHRVFFFNLNIWTDDFLTVDMNVFMKHKVTTRFIFYWSEGLYFVDFGNCIALFLLFIFFLFILKHNTKHSIILNMRKKLPFFKLFSFCKKC